MTLILPCPVLPCHHSTHPSLPSAIQEGVLDSSNFVAVRDIRAGEAITISYGLKPSIRFLTDYGFVLPRNLHDFIELAGSKAQLMAYFDLHAQREAGSEEEERGTREMMGAVIDRVEEEVAGIVEYLRERGALESRDDSGPQYDLSGDKPFAVWGSGGVDPRALAALSALWHIFYHQQGKLPGNMPESMTTCIESDGWGMQQEEQKRNTR